MKTNPSIKCDVETCEHNDCKTKYCKLKEIKVSCNCNNSEVSNKDETICSSYKKTN